MTTITLPTGCIEMWSYRVVPEAAESESAFGTNSQSFVRVGQHLAFDLTTMRMRRGNGLDWSRLAQPNASMIWAIDQGDLVAANEGSPRVAGAGQLGMTLNVDGVTAGYEIPQDAIITHVTAAARRYCYPIASAVTASGTGAVALPLLIPLRVTPSDNDVVKIAAPEVQGRVLGFSGLTRQRRRGDVIPSFTFTLRERG